MKRSFATATITKAAAGGRRIGLALGGGGAKGLAHVSVLEVFDELGIRPVCIAGTSIGAAIGVIYCSGVRARDIHSSIRRMSLDEDLNFRKLVAARRDIRRWLDFVSPQFQGRGLFRSENFVDFIFEGVAAETFEDLEIPLKVVATDFWSRSQVVFESGPLRPALQASLSLPGLFAPVVLDGRVLIDGGAVNPVPFDLLPDDCDLTVAVDVIGRRTTDGGPPTLTEALFNTYQIMEKSIIREKLRASAPDLYVEPDIRGIRVLEFYRAEEIFRKARATQNLLREELTSRLSHPG
jgi:NTE family protein